MYCLKEKKLSVGMSREVEGDSVCSQVKDGIHVSVRIRPLSSDEMCSGIRPCCLATSKASLVITKEGDSTAYLKSQAGSEAEFAFDAVFDEYASQIEVYKKSAMPFMPKLIMGENVTIFAYGATGAGRYHYLAFIVFLSTLMELHLCRCRENSHYVREHPFRFYGCICWSRHHSPSSS